MQNIPGDLWQGRRRAHKHVAALTGADMRAEPASVRTSPP